MWGIRELLGICSNALEQASDAVMIVDRNNRVLLLNRSAEEFWGCSRDEVIGQSANLLLPELVSRCHADLNDSLRLDLHNRSGERRQGLISALQVETEQERVVVIFIRSLLQEGDDHAGTVRIAQMSLYDGLTGLPGRGLLQLKAEQAIAEARRDGGALAAIFVDIDRFKWVSDSFGFPAGDGLLQLIAQRLQAGRQPGDLVARLFCDEFVLLLPGCDRAEARAQALRLRAILQASCPLAGITYTPSVSLGISLFPDDGDSVDELIQHADTAMGRAKSLPEGICFFSHELTPPGVEQLPLESALRSALEHGQLRLHYQPQVSLADGSLYGVEALARWRHDELGDISPVRFIPLAEQCGLIDELGRWSLSEGCRQLAAWRRAGLDVPSLSINLSPSNFHDPGLPGVILQTLTGSGLLPSDLTLEITESVLLYTSSNTLKVLQEVRGLGVRLSLDDFGTGFSSLSHLQRLPIQEIKLDRSFVSDLEQDATSRTLSKAVAGLSDNLNLTAVAEGIETWEQYRILRGLGYRVAQGYLFSRPLPGDELAHWLTLPRQGFSAGRAVADCCSPER
ncbi:intracellular signaling protein [Stutzerimonas kirkiae]|uniref:Intracellular signaling protein n=1 Tax=Stutzerimonas kirkiae TaxID=2211392 RepID=A0A4Q9QZF9_9GAMM|nr:EAL domain-containing protein [Stutzerimonas kirkiae]TBU91280.1 intracellular signaling protein [Stutzerimonas kirkiae]TBV00450.1 intracellular signaling protein [Stutzerimonas kirkiae]